MATTPATSISSSYQRIGGSTPVIKQGTPGPELSDATKERLRLAEERKLEEERQAASLRGIGQKTSKLAALRALEEEQALAEQRRKYNLLQTNLPQWAAEEQAGIVGRIGGNEAYKKYMNEQGGDANKPWIPPQFRK